MGEETFNCTLCLFVQPVLCLQIKIQIGTKVGVVLSQVVSEKYEGFCLDVHGCWHMYRHGRYRKSLPLQAWSGPEGSRKLRLPDYVTMAQDGGNVVSPIHRPPLPPGNAPGIHFC